MALLNILDYIVVYVGAILLYTFHLLDTLYVYVCLNGVK